MSKKNVEWEWKKLGDVCEIVSGRNQKAVEVPNGKYPIYGSGGEMGRANSFICPAGCTIVGRKGSINNPIFVNEPFWNVDTAFGFSPKKNCNSFFLFYFCKSFDFYSMNKGTTIPSLVKADLLEISIPIPPLDEQERIVKVLDDAFEKIDAIKTTAETNLQNAKDLFQTTLKKLFSEISKDNHELLKNVAIDFSRGKSKHRPRNDKKLFGGNYPFIQTGDIRNSGKYLIEYTDTYNEFGLSQSKLWPKGTLCITIAANIAETTILTIPCCFPDSVIGFIPNEKRTTVDYVFYVLQFFKSELQILGKGAAQDNLNLATFEKMTFPFPPLPIQKQIVAKLDSLSEKVKQLESNYKQVLADCDELKKALLKQAFEGML